MTPLEQALLLSLLAGAAIPVGASIALVERIGPQWLEQEFRHSVIAFGGGALLAAVALVLVPDGIRPLSVSAATAAFAGGGLAFLVLDRLVAFFGGSASQLMAMLLDFVPEAMAMGATFAQEDPSARLLVLLIALQNLPEGFNAYREITARAAIPRRPAFVAFWTLTLLGPLCAFIGMQYLAGQTVMLGALMVFCAGGILYLTFQDIAPQAKLERHWAPALGAVSGFLLGMIGHMLIVGTAG